MANKIKLTLVLLLLKIVLIFEWIRIAEFFNSNYTYSYFILKLAGYSITVYLLFFLHETTKEYGTKLSISIPVYLLCGAFAYSFLISLLPAFSEELNYSMHEIGQRKTGNFLLRTLPAFIELISYLLLCVYLIRNDARSYKQQIRLTGIAFRIASAGLMVLSLLAGIFLNLNIYGAMLYYHVTDIIQALPYAAMILLYIKILSNEASASQSAD